jgi:hypothetical protein
MFEDAGGALRAARNPSRPIAPCADAAFNASAQFQLAQPAFASAL